MSMGLDLDCGRCFAASSRPPFQVPASSICAMVSSTPRLEKFVETTLNSSSRSATVRALHSTMVSDVAEKEAIALWDIRFVRGKVSRREVVDDSRERRVRRDMVGGCTIGSLLKLVVGVRIVQIGIRVCGCRTQTLTSPGTNLRILVVDTVLDENCFANTFCL